MKELSQSSSLEKLCDIICRQGVYNYYRIIKTPNHIEVKLSPKDNSLHEVVFSVDNDRTNKRNLKFSLYKMVID